MQFEADRRALIITINSFGTELSKDDRVKLYPTCGRLHPDGLAALARADDYEQVRNIAEYYAVSRLKLNIHRQLNGHLNILNQEYRELFENSGNNPGDKTLEDKFFEYEVLFHSLEIFVKRRVNVNETRHEFCNAG